MVTAEPTPRPEAGEEKVPLVVDLEAALLATGLVDDGLIALVRQRPFDLLKLPAWRFAGRARMMREVAARVTLETEDLPHRAGLSAFLAARKREGTPLVLVTGGNRENATALAPYIADFDVILAADDRPGASGPKRHERIMTEFGAGEFDYLGADREDLPVWADARHAILVAERGSRLPAEVAARTEVERVFEIGGREAWAVFSAMRPHQWSKNLLVLLPLGPGRLLFDPTLMLEAFVAIIAFCLTASSGYLFNDLMDLPADRHHPNKRHRAVAAGRLRVGRAMALALGLLAAGIGVGAFLPPAFLGILAIYYVTTIAYSWCLKNLLVLDVLVLASLYGLRVAAGSVATGIPPSAWLLAFCLFIFLSLAMVKRYAELVTMRRIDGGGAHARAYLLEDAELLAALGAASGFISVLVLALYIDSDAVHEIYARPHLLWPVCPLLLYWITYTWLMTHRGRLGDDPTVFAVRDRVSLILILLMVAAMVAAT